jgi:hypothetical protein
MEAFLTHLAVQGKVAALDSEPGANAIVFLYRQVLKKGLRLAQGCRARQEAGHRLPVVFSHAEARTGSDG